MAQTKAPPGLHSAFFYGTLMAPAVLARVTSRHVSEITSSADKHPQSDVDSVAKDGGFIPLRAPLRARPAILHKHTRRRVKEADYPAVIPDSGMEQTSAVATDHERSVRGTWVTNLTESDLWRLDLFEGDEYERRPVKVSILSGQVDQATGVRTLQPRDTLNPSSALSGQEAADTEAEAETYIWIAGVDRLEEREWDFDEFVREKMWRWAGGMRQDIIAVDEAVAAKEKSRDGTGGRAIGGEFDKMWEQPTTSQ